MLTTLSSLPIKRITHPLNATVRVPGSKSLTNRTLLIAALANGTTHLTNALFSDDSKYFAKTLQTLGFDVQLDETNREMTVTGLGGKIRLMSGNQNNNRMKQAARTMIDLRSMQILTNTLWMPGRRGRVQRLKARAETTM